MDLTSDVFSDILSPLAAFVQRDAGTPACPGTRARHEAEGPHVGDAGNWERCPLNPQSRIDSLTPRVSSSWRVDGVDVDGRRFFAVPVFAIGAPPLRIDVYLPPVEEYPGWLREVLKPDAVIYAGKKGLHGQPVVQHLLRALEHWSSGMLDFERQYRNMPFGSQILVASIAAGLDDMTADMHLCPNYDVEGAMMSVDVLQGMWGLEKSAWPPVVEWAELRFKRQLHEAITLLEIPSVTGEGREVVFKALLRDQRYMYNELKTLLTLRPHPNIVSRPLCVVVKRGRFGGKRGVCGFVVEYFPMGTLKERLLDATSGAVPRIADEQRFRWSRQITEALIHINNHPAGFYPDLKPDNVVLRETRHRDSDSKEIRLDVVLLDLEQRGGWFSWSPPEVAYVEILEILASGLPDDQEDVRSEIARELEGFIAGWAPTSQQDRYHNSEGGFSRPWRALLQKRHQGAPDLEKAQVFMLGKLLWCIFEGTPLVRCGIDHELLQDNGFRWDMGGQAFPEFRKTPNEVQDLLRRCTEGAPEWEDEKRRRGVILWKGKLVAAALGSRGLETAIRSAEKSRETASKWWDGEVEQARRFLQNRVANVEDDSVLAAAKKRPTMAEVLGEILRFEGRLAK
ncbi:hypothetical protein B0T25DRAFT_554487 [Lasiosphaeria hispida]|uniref:Protein kinase domain-containing protein n=1 Tax=Lasiosphaeria hispida TaxID=260671 RepID=A0AAJ0M952_9PEZI|nr:hypothetical protein B0T25DRAFT_554487 [Lasiosphaeria hispida]